MKNLIICKNMLGQKRKANYINKFNFIDKTYNKAYTKDVNNLYMNLFNLYRKNIKKNNNIVIGGDHSLAISTLSSTIMKYGPNNKIIWIDAHCDVNSQKASVSKNVHGMVLNYILKLHSYNRNQYNLFVPSRKINTENIMYLGIRHIDAYEKEILEKYSIKYILSNEINNNTERCINKINNFLHKSKYHLSIDIDGLSPNYVPCTETPVEKGIELNALI